MQERNKQFFHELKFLQSRMNRRDERLSQEALPIFSCNQSMFRYLPWLMNLCDLLCFGDLAVKIHNEPFAIAKS